MASSPAFQFYPGDFVTGTIHMTAEEIGGYMLLLCTQWEQGSLPPDPASLKRIARCSAKAMPAILTKFAMGSDGQLRNERMESVRSERDRFRKKQGICAKQRWKDKKSDATAMPPHQSGINLALPTQCQNDALQSSSSSSNKDIAATPPKVKKTSDQTPRQRNPLFDALAAAFGLVPESKTDASLIGKVTASLKAKGATPEEIPRRIENYQRHMPNALCTITALDKHWSMCAKPPPQPCLRPDEAEGVLMNEDGSCDYDWKPGDPC